MRDRIYLPPDLAEDKEVVLVGGRCYEREGPSNQAPDTFEVEEVYETCEECENPPSGSDSSSSEQGSGSESDQSQNSSSGSVERCDTTRRAQLSDGPNGSGGTDWTSYPDRMSKGGSYTLTFYDPGGLTGNVYITGNFVGTDVTLTDAGGGTIDHFSPEQFVINFGSSTERSITIGFSLSDDDGSGSLICVEVDFIGGTQGQDEKSKILEYPVNP